MTAKEDVDLKTPHKGQPAVNWSESRLNLVQFTLLQLIHLTIAQHQSATQRNMTAGFNPPQQTEQGDLETFLRNYPGGSNASANNMQVGEISQPLFEVQAPGFGRKRVIKR